MQNLNYNTALEFDEINITMSNRRKTEQAEYENAVNWLISEAEEARRIADEQGWISLEEIEKEFGIRRS